MPATAAVQVYHGAGPTESAWTSGGRYHRADDDPTTDGSTTPIQIPAAGNNNSWRKSHKLKFTTAPAGSITNLRWFDGSSWGTGVTLYAKKTASYTQATSTDESMATTGYTDASTYTSGSPLTITAGTVLSNPTTGTGTQDYVETFLRVGTTASPGAISGHTLSYRYDET